MAPPGGARCVHGSESAKSPGAAAGCTAALVPNAVVEGSLGATTDLQVQMHTYASRGQRLATDGRGYSRLSMD